MVKIYRGLAKKPLPGWHFAIRRPEERLLADAEHHNYGPLSKTHFYEFSKADLVFEGRKDYGKFK